MWMSSFDTEMGLEYSGTDIVHSKSNLYSQPDRFSHIGILSWSPGAMQWGSWSNNTKEAKLWLMKSKFPNVTKAQASETF